MLSMSLGKEADMTVVNHWGKWVDSEVPTTGVFSNHDFTSWFWEEVNMNGIDPDAKEYEQQCRQEWEADYPDAKDGREFYMDDYWDGYEQSTALMGFMENDTEDAIVASLGPCLIDPTAEWSGIVTVNGAMPITQVVRSLWGIRCALGSPCIPGQGDADTPGEFLCYSVPPDLVEDEELKARIFKLV